ncbi:MAG: hypothetical protein AAGO57_04615 [Pseudomonadota bacterium]
MKTRTRDQNGVLWEISWGISDPMTALRGEFGVSGALQSTKRLTAFADPLYPAETKTLRVYETDHGVEAAMAEITPGVYAAGVRAIEREAGAGDDRRKAILTKIARSGHPSVRFERFYRHFNGTSLTSIPDWSAEDISEITVMVDAGLLDKSEMRDGPWLNMGETESHIALTEAGRALIDE